MKTSKILKVSPAFKKPNLLTQKRIMKRNKRKKDTTNANIKNKLTFVKRKIFERSQWKADNNPHQVGQNELLLTSSINLTNELIKLDSPYDINKDSVFIDIGSSFGRVTATVKTIIGCRSIGIEICEANVYFAKDKYKYVKNLEFYHGNACLMGNLIKQATHIFSFNVIWVAEDIEKTAKIIYASKKCKVLIWSLKENETLEVLTNFRLSHQLHFSFTGGQNFAFYVYLRNYS